MELLKEKERCTSGSSRGGTTRARKYYTEAKAKELDYKSPSPGRTWCGRRENYYFKLSAFQERWRSCTREPEFSPRGARNR